MRCDVTPNQRNPVLRRIAIAAHDISLYEGAIKNHLALIPTAFEQWASTQQYDLARVVNPDTKRLYADLRTQDAYDAWIAGAAHIAKGIIGGIIEDEVLTNLMYQLRREA